MNIGASWGIQLIAALTAFAFGAAGSIPALLFFRKARFAERILTDFFASAVLILLYIASAETGNRGQVEWFTVAAFLAGTASFAKLARTVFAKLGHKRKLRIGRKLENSAEN